MEKTSIFPGIFSERNSVPNPTIAETYLSSVADPGCLYRIPDPNFSIPDPGSASKNLNTGILTPKNGF
jgi:hypothetical protein